MHTPEHSPSLHTKRRFQLS